MNRRAVLLIVVAAVAIVAYMAYKRRGATSKAR